MMNSKRAMGTFMMTLVIIIGIAALLLLMAFGYKIYQGSEKNAYLTRCQMSVISYSKLNSLPFNRATSDSANIDCPTQFLTVSKSTPRLMKKDVADLLVECWKNYGEGRLLLFKPSDEAFCSVCSVIQFEDKKVKLDRFNSFLMAERAPVRNKDGSSPLYFDYLASYATDPKIKTEFENMPSDIDGSQKYAIIFAYYKGSFAKKLDAAGKALILGPFWALIAYIGTSAADWQATTFLVPYSAENIKTVGCTEIPVSMVDKQFR